MQRFYEDEELLGNSTEWSPTVKGRCAARSEADYLWHRAIVLEAHAESKYTVCEKETRVRVHSTVTIIIKVAD